MKYLSKALALLLIVAIWHSFSGPSESWLRARDVKISNEHGMCSGEQVRAPSGVDYILTAGHCKGIIVDGNALVTDSFGREISRKVIAEDPNSDLLLLEGLPSLRGLEIGTYEEHEQHVRTFTHGGNMPDHKTEGELMGYQEVDIAVSQIENAYQEAKCILLPKNQAINVDTPFGSVELCMMVLNETAVTASIVPGSSGGMMVNDAGQLIGVASCTDSHFGYFVTLNDIKAFLSGY